MNVEENLREAKKNTELNKRLNFSKILPADQIPTVQSPKENREAPIGGPLRFRKSSDNTTQIGGYQGGLVVEQSDLQRMQRKSSNSDHLYDLSDAQLSIMDMRDPMQAQIIEKRNSEQIESKQVGGNVGGSGTPAQQRRLFPRISEHQKESTSSNNCSPLANFEEGSFTLSYQLQQQQNSAITSEYLNQQIQEQNRDLSDNLAKEKYDKNRLEKIVIRKKSCFLRGATGALPQGGNSSTAKRSSVALGESITPQSIDSKGVHTVDSIKNARGRSIQKKPTQFIRRTSKESESDNSQEAHNSLLIVSEPQLPKDDDEPLVDQKSKHSKPQKKGTRFIKKNRDEREYVESESSSSGSDGEERKKVVRIKRIKVKKDAIAADKPETKKLRKQPTKHVRIRNKSAEGEATFSQLSSQYNEMSRMSSSSVERRSSKSKIKSNQYQSPHSKQKQDLSPEAQPKFGSGMKMGFPKTHDNSEGRRASTMAKYGTSLLSPLENVKKKVQKKSILSNIAKKESSFTIHNIASASINPSFNQNDNPLQPAREFKTPPFNDSGQNKSSESPSGFNSKKLGALPTIPALIDPFTPSEQVKAKKKGKNGSFNFRRRESSNPSSSAQVKAQQTVIQLKRRATIQKFDNVVKAVQAFQDHQKIEMENSNDLPRNSGTSGKQDSGKFPLFNSGKLGSLPAEKSLSPPLNQKLKPPAQEGINSGLKISPQIKKNNSLTQSDQYFDQKPTESGGEEKVDTIEPLQLEAIQSMLTTKIIEKLSKNQLPMQEQIEQKNLQKLSRRQQVESDFLSKVNQMNKERESVIGTPKRRSLFDIVRRINPFADSNNKADKSVSSNIHQRRISVQVSRIKSFARRGSIKQNIIGLKRSPPKKKYTLDQRKSQDKTLPLTPTPVLTKEEKQKRLLERGKALWKKARSAIKALNAWKQVRDDVLLYGTHNYDLREDFKVLQTHQINNLMHSNQVKVVSSRDKFKTKGVSLVTARRPSLMHQGMLQVGLNSHKEQGKKKNCFAKIAKRGLYFHPESRFKQIWSVIIIIFLLYVAFLMPFSLAFYDESQTSSALQSNNFDPVVVNKVSVENGKSEKEIELTTTIDNNDKGGAYFIDIIADFIFLLDVFVISFSAYYDDNEGTLVTNNKRIFKNYASGWFWVDLVTSVPVSLIEDSLNFVTHTEYIKILRFLRIPRLRRLLEVSRLGQFFRTITKDSFFLKLQDFLQENAGIMRLLMMVFTLVSCIHVAACFWFFTFKLSDYSPDSWVVRMNYQDESIAKKYLVSLYWAIATILTVGYGDLSGKTTLERGVAIIWMLIGVAFYAFIIGLITSVLDRIDTKESHLNSKLETIEQFCQEASITLDLKKKIRENLEYHSTKNAFTVINQRHNAVFADLPIQLRYEVAMQIHDGAIGRLPFFQNKDSTFVANIVPLLQPLKSKANEYLYQKGDHPYEIFFICQGRVNFHMDIGECVFKSWPKGSYFGEIEIIFDKRRICSAKAAPETDCDLFVLNKKYYQTIIHRDYPDINKELRKTGLEREVKIIKALKKATEVLQAIGIEDPALASPKLQIERSQDVSHSNIIKRSQTLVSIRKEENPKTKAHLQKINRGFNEVQAGRRSFNASSISRRSYSDSVLFSEEELGSSDKVKELDPIKRNQQKIERINQEMSKNLRFRRSMTENNESATKKEADRLNELNKNLLSLPTEEALLKSDETGKVIGSPKPGLSKFGEEYHRRSKLIQIGKMSILVEKSENQLITGKNPLFENKKFEKLDGAQDIIESEITESDEEDESSGSNSGHNIWNNNKKSEGSKLESESDKDSAKKLEEKKEGQQLNQERLKTLKFLQGKKTAKFGSQSTNMQQMSIASVNTTGDEKQQTAGNSPNPHANTILKVQSPKNTSLFAPLKKSTFAEKKDQDSFLNSTLAAPQPKFSTASMTNILRPSAFSNSTFAPIQKALSFDINTIQISLCSDSVGVITSLYYKLEKFREQLDKSQQTEMKVIEMEKSLFSMISVLEQLMQKLANAENEQAKQQAEYNRLAVAYQDQCSLADTLRRDLELSRTLRFLEEAKVEDQDKLMIESEVINQPKMQSSLLQPVVYNQLTQTSFVEPYSQDCDHHHQSTLKSHINGDLRGMLRHKLNENNSNNLNRAALNVIEISQTSELLSPNPKSITSPSQGAAFDFTPNILREQTLQSSKKKIKLQLRKKNSEQLELAEGSSNLNKGVSSPRLGQHQ